MPTTPAILYAAKSTADRHASIPTQLEECRELAEAEGWTVVDEYKDEGFSAYSGNRGPDLAKAREHAARLAAETGELVMLLAQAHDRFARGAGDAPDAPESLGEVWHALRRVNVHLRTVEDDEELRDEAAVAAIGRRAHIDSRRKSKSVAKGLARRRAKGLHTGGRVFGFDAADDLGLRANADAATVVDIFTRVAAGESQASVARGLNARGVRPLRGEAWRQSSISKMIRRRSYLGEVKAESGEGWTPGAHDAIVTADLWQAAHDAVELVAAQPGNGGGPRPNAGHLLTGRMLRHGACGRAMVPRTHRARKDGTAGGDYICSGLKDGLCDGLSVPMGAVDDAVVGYLGRVGIDADASRRAVTDAADSRRTATADALADARRELADLDGQLARVKADYRAGAISADEWHDLRADIAGEREATAARVAQLETQATAADADPADTIPRVADGLAIVRGALAAGDRDRVRAALAALFSEFTIGRLTDDDPPDPDDLTAGDRVVIVPEPRQSMVGYVDAEGGPVLRRIPLATTDDAGLTM